jgi:hypothetical protein
VVVEVDLLDGAAVSAGDASFTVATPGRMVEVALNFR